VLLRQPGGGFAAEPALSVGSTGSVAAADFNGDGRVDIAATSLNGSTVATYLRNAANTGFSQEGTPNPTGSGPRDVVAADFNADGRPDLATSNLNAGSVTVLLRRPGGGFASKAAAIPVGTSPEGIDAADFNGDGLPDIAVAVLGTNTVNVLLRQAGGKGFVALTAAANIPIGSQLDTRKGRVTLTTAADTAGQKTQSADFYDGIFQIEQTVPKQKPKTPTALITDLVMKGQIARSRCAPPKGARAAAAEKKKGPKAVLGQLWGNGKGKFRTNGKYSSATVRGTIWLVQDRCEGTLTKVRRGTVAVRDFKRRRTVTVKAGHGYLARAQPAASKARR
jgi:hypothetical protein